MPSTRSSVAIASLIEATLLRQAGLEARAFGSAHGLLGQPYRLRWPARHHLRQLERLLKPLLLRGHLVDQTERLRLQRVDPTSGHDQLHRPLPAHRARDPLGRPAARDDPQQDLGLAELRGVARHHHVAEQRQLEAGPERIARYGGDERRAAGGHPRPEARRCIEERASLPRIPTSRPRPHPPRSRCPRQRSRCSGPRGRSPSPRPGPPAAPIRSAVRALRVSGQFRRASAMPPPASARIGSSVTEPARSRRLPPAR